MPGKVNPVIPEAVTQCAMLAFGYDAALGMACASGSLELNPFLPLVAFCLLESLDLLSNACGILSAHCVEGIAADEARCRQGIDQSTAVVTALVPTLGYERACAVAREARETGQPIRDVVLAADAMSPEEFEQAIGPEAVCRLGSEAAVNFQPSAHSARAAAKPVLRREASPAASRTHGKLMADG
jgi:aspartate ammonia-lyase